MACCLTASSHYMNQCCFLIRQVLWHSPEGNSTRKAQDINPWNEFKNCSIQITTASPKCQCVKNYYPMEGQPDMKIWLGLSALAQYNKIITTVRHRSQRNIHHAKPQNRIHMRTMMYLLWVLAIKVQNSDNLMSHPFAIFIRCRIAGMI